MLEYLIIIEYKLTDMLSAPSIIRKINNSSFKGYVNKKLNKKLNIGDTRRAEEILNSLKFKRLEKIEKEKDLGTTRR